MRPMWPVHDLSGLCGPALAYAWPMRAYVDLCGPMRTYAGLFGTKRLDLRTKDIPFKCLSRRGACPPGGAAAPSVATAVTHSASMRPAIADSQATEEQLRAGECVRAARPDGGERGHREERPGATDFLRALRGVTKGLPGLLAGALAQAGSR